MTTTTHGGTYKVLMTLALIALALLLALLVSCDYGPNAPVADDGAQAMEVDLNPGDWRVEVFDPDGDPLGGAVVTVDGEHFVTAPDGAVTIDPPLGTMVYFTVHHPDHGTTGTFDDVNAAVEGVTVIDYATAHLMNADGPEDVVDMDIPDDRQPVTHTELDAPDGPCPPPNAPSN